MSAGIDWIIFAGHCDDVGRALNAIDVLVHPALIEGFANVALQAMAAEIPVVSSAVGGMPESVRDGETGLLVAPGDSRALAAAVSRLLDDEALRRRLGRRGSAVVDEEFTVRTMVARYYDLYTRLLEEGG